MLKYILALNREAQEQGCSGVILLREYEQRKERKLRTEPWAHGFLRDTKGKKKGKRSPLRRQRGQKGRTENQIGGGSDGQREGQG